LGPGRPLRAGIHYASNSCDAPRRRGDVWTNSLFETEAETGEWKAQSCDIAWLRQLPPNVPGLGVSVLPADLEKRRRYVQTLQTREVHAAQQGLKTRLRLKGLERGINFQKNHVRIMFLKGMLQRGERTFLLT
jgi:hypothetical protein